MGPVASKIIRKMRRINIEERAHKEISKEKRPAAPRHPTSAHIVDKLITENPELQTDVSKNAALDDRLRQVFVTSEIEKICPEETSERKLPQIRRSFESAEFGVEEPSVIPEGRYSLREALKFISDHQQNPELWTTTALAKEYKVDEDIIRNILHHFKTFDVYVPDKIAAKPKAKEQRIEGK